MIGTCWKKTWNRNDNRPRGRSQQVHVCACEWMLFPFFLFSPVTEQSSSLHLELLVFVAYLTLTPLWFPSILTIFFPSLIKVHLWLLNQKENEHSYDPIYMCWVNSQVSHWNYKVILIWCLKLTKFQNNPWNYKPSVKINWRC